MAISDNTYAQALKGKHAHQEAEARREQEHEHYEQHPNQPDRAPRRFSWSSIGHSAGYSMSRSPISETLQNTTNALQEVFKNHQESDYRVKLIPMDIKDYPNLAISLLLVSLIDLSISAKTVATHVLVIEGSVEPFPPKVENYLGKNYEVQVPASDIVHTDAMVIVRDEIARQFPDHHQLYADMEVVPRSFDLEDKSLVYSLAVNSMLAVESVLFSLQDRAELNIAYAESDSTLSVKVNYVHSADQLKDDVGLPMRSDIDIGVFSQLVNHQPSNVSNMMVQRQSQIGFVAGYMDTLWDPVVQSTPYSPYAMQGQNPYQYSQASTDGSAITAKIRGMFVITEARMKDVSSLTSQLFSLLPSLLLRDGDMWMSAFKPRANVGDIDFKNVGALNIEVNLPIGGHGPDPSGRGQIIDVNSANFNADSFYQYMAATFRKGIGIAIDVEEAGSSTWATSIFNSVAGNSKEAYDDVYNAVNYLTDGNFQKNFPYGKAIVEYFTTIQNGWYIDTDNRTRRDIRDFDLIALLNHPMGEDRQVVDTFINSYVNRNQPMNVNLAERFRIIQMAFGEVHLTGFSHRLVFTDDFLNAFLEAAGNAGLLLRPQSAMQDVTGGRMSAGFNANMFGSNPQMNHNVFAPAAMSSPNQYGGGFSNINTSPRYNKF